MKYLLSLLFALSAFAQTVPNAVAPPAAELQYLDVNGAPLAGAYLCTFGAGTTTPQATYTDNTAGTANANPIVLDSGGRAQVWIGPLAYKFVLYDPDGTQACPSTGTVEWTQDNLLDSTLNFLNYVKTAGTATLITYTAPVTGAVQRTVSARLADSVSIKDFGAVCNGVADDTAAIALAFASGASLWVPDGNCLINNSSGPVTATSFVGSLQFSGNARFVCTNAEGDCFLFMGGGPAKIQGMRLAYQTPSTNYGECSGTFTSYPTHTGNCWYLGVRNTTGFEFDHLFIEGGFGIGLVTVNTTALKLSNIYVQNVTGGGLLLLNGQDTVANNVSVYTSADDGINVGAQTNYTGSTNSGVTVTNYTALTLGGCLFKVGGATNVKLSNFYGYDVHHSGLCLENEPSSSEAPVGFDDVVITNGTVQNINTGGIAACYMCVFNNDGLDIYSDQTAAFGGRVFVSNVSFQDMEGAGISAINNAGPTNKMTESVLNGVNVKNTGSGTHNYSSCSTIADVATVHLNQLNCNTIAYNAMLFNNNGDIFVNGAVIINANTVNDSQHVALFANIQNSITVQGLRVLDPSNRAYTFGESNTANYGNFADIQGYTPLGVLTPSIGTPSKTVLSGQIGAAFYVPGMKAFTVTDAGPNLLTLNATGNNAAVQLINNTVAANQAAISYQDQGASMWTTGHLASNVSPADAWFLYDNMNGFLRILQDGSAVTCSTCGTGRLNLNPTGAGVVTIHLPIYASDAAAIAAGLVAGDLFADSSGGVHVTY